ncbi:GGDEF domain-containing protein [Thalassotalea sp. HSM 43]|uniref:GGDEF domain-containing protein n=1 Tax=Thalassotalea sp. HSM 43 TaxID=2552945 RepID=UPI0010817670|nr:GGDEF domain-containing protein [Thalassotalea sp. HSM 43]QBY04306.1 GGDEF domain-containing protein [Thalassotalea sp. HSM 43]
MLKQIVQYGTELKPFHQAARIRMSNYVSIFTVFIALSYSLLYLLVLGKPLVGIINLTFTFAYAIGPWLMKYNRIYLAKNWFFGVLLLHLWVTTNVYVDNQSGMHLYYYLVPTGVFLLFDTAQIKTKALHSIAAIALFFYCENVPNPQPLIVLDDAMNHAIYQSVVLFTMVEVIIVLVLFSRQSRVYENQLSIYETTDMLTGCTNKQYFLIESAKLFNDARKAQRPLSLMVVLISESQQMIKNYGHQITEQYTRHVADKLKSLVGEGMLLARVSDRGFALVMPETTLVEGNYLQDRIQNIFADDVMPVAQLKVQAPIHTGISAMLSDADDVEELYHRAELDMLKQQPEHKPAATVVDKLITT